MEATGLFLFIVALLAVTLSVFGNRRKQNLPPGPRGLPVIGSTLSILLSNPYQKFSEWAYEYGNLLTVNIFARDALILSCPKQIRELFSHPASSGKYPIETFHILAGGPYGITSAEGSMWSEQRRFCVRSLKQFGFGSKTSLEPHIVSEADEVVQWIKSESRKNEDGTVSLIDVLKNSTSNTLWKIVTGERIHLENPTVYKITGEFIRAMNYSVKSGFTMFPWIKHFAPVLSGYTDLMTCSKKLHRFIKDQFNEHQKTTTPGTEPRDMIDAYIEQMKLAENDATSSFHGKLGENNSIASIAELFQGGGESTPHTLNWLVLYLSHHQNLQKRLHEEIDKIIGTNRDPSLMDRPQMPFTEAVILETFRIRPAFPLTSPHMLTQDVEMFGYNLPKGLILLSNMYHAHHDKNVWGDPEQFRPDRFLGSQESQSEIGNADAGLKNHVIPFNLGKRYCLGAPLAQDVMFLFVVKLFQVFHVCLPETTRAMQPGFDEPSEGGGGVLLTAKPFKVLMKVRA